MTYISFSRLFLSQVHVEQELLIYEAFPYDQQQPQNNLKVRFKKVSLPLKLCQKDEKIKSSAARSGEANTNRLRSVRHRYPTTSTSERRNQSLKRIRRRRAEPRRTARAPKVGSPDSDTLRISRDTPG